jgi:FkbM family methyltransferase
MSRSVPLERHRVRSRLWRFLKRPWHEKLISAKAFCGRQLSDIPIPIRLPFGAIWLARNDNVGEAIRSNKFENAESAFVSRYLRPGMNVLDIGANQGYYTLLASQKVGSAGRVISFEPSPRERKALQIHKWLNVCKNIQVIGLAVGFTEGPTELLVVQGHETGCNSLRPPVVLGETKPVRVEVVRLDGWLEANKIDRVDFIKLDVEGAELDALKGAVKLLQTKPRPLVLVEVQDLRTKAWGYPAKEILIYLRDRDYIWYGFSADGTTKLLNLDADCFEGNFLACPNEVRSIIEARNGA